MPKFEVTLGEEISYTLVVEADDAEQAGEEAEAVFVECAITKLQTCVHAREVENVALADPSAPLSVDEAVLTDEQDLLSWAVNRWREEVEHRPLVNVHRRTLDDTWRQVVRKLGGDPDALLGPCHDVLLAEAEKVAL